MLKKSKLPSIVGIDRKDLFSYLRTCRSWGLGQGSIEVSKLTSLDVFYDYENFIIYNKDYSILIDDWDLSNQELELVLKMARDTEKFLEQQERQAKKALREKV